MPHANGSAEALPPIAALFLVVFDQKIGYKVAWQRSLSDTQLDGVVEYKSLPSGLHNVQQDLIYFTQGEYAGLSAFVSKPADEASRNAHFVAVGVYVPLSYGRLGRAWMHTSGLRELAEASVVGTDGSAELEAYWNTHRLDSKTDELQQSALEEPSSPLAPRPVDSKAPKRRSRALSDAAGFSTRNYTLSPNHPALSMPDFLNAFGPLVFPLYRQALLRRRILFLGSAPIQRSCDFVYDLSIFSNIPPSLADELPAKPNLHRLKPLFNVGIHDIAELKAKSVATDKDAKTGWVACTTDDIIATKTDLYDVLVELPPTTTSNSWPKITTSDGQHIRATQRDLRRYNSLRRELFRMERLRARYRDEEEAIDDNPASSPESPSSPDEDDDTHPLMNSTTSLPNGNISHNHSEPTSENESAITEPSSWASIAYSSFLWWASAGERSAAEDEETEQDASLLQDLVHSTTTPITPLSPASPVKTSRDALSKRKKRSSATSLTRLVSGPESDEEEDAEPSLEGKQQISLILMAYFHRLTGLHLSGLDEVVGAADDEAEEGEGGEEETIYLSAEDVAGLGLDVWSEGDAKFVADLGRLWWERDVKWSGRSVECCGVRIC